MINMANISRFKLYYLASLGILNPTRTLIEKKREYIFSKKDYSTLKSVQPYLQEGYSARFAYKKALIKRKIKDKASFFIGQYDKKVLIPLLGKGKFREELLEGLEKILRDMPNNMRNSKF